MPNGVDLTGDVFKQSSCGACHATSFVSAVQSRLEIKYGKKIDKLSVQFLLSCNYLNEGCDGGWPLLNSFIAEQTYLVTDKCAPYQANTDNQQCVNFADCAPVAKVSSTNFMQPLSSGSYEERAQAIQKEILRNGPVATNLFAPKYFKFYKMGVLTNDMENDAKIDEKLLQLKLIDEDDEPIDKLEQRIVAESNMATQTIPVSDDSSNSSQSLS